MVKKHLLENLDHKKIPQNHKIGSRELFLFFQIAGKILIAYKTLSNEPMKLFRLQEHGIKLLILHIFP